MTTKDRIDIFIERQGIKRAVFEKSCGFSNGYTRNLKENPSASKIEDILRSYPELNRVWLLSGEGEMLRTTSTNVGEVSGDCNTLGMTVNQSIGENSGQNAGRDINNYCAKQFLHELAEMRKLMERQLNVYTSSLEKEKEQIKAANAQIETLIRNNQEQFNRLLVLLESK